MTEDELDLEELSGESSDLVYGFAAAPGFIPGQSGTAFAALSSGLVKTVDGGQTWEDVLGSLNLSEPVPVTSLAIAPDFAHAGSVFGGAPGGVFCSTDSGNTWGVLGMPSPPPTVSALAISPNFSEDDIVIAGTMEDGIFVSSEGGQRWVAWNFGLFDLNILCLAISPAFGEDETIFAGVESGIFRSTNGGRAWREIELPTGFEAVLSLALSTNYAGDHTLLAGTESQGVWISRDEGETWARLAENEIIDPVNAIYLSGGCEQILVVTSQGLWISDDCGQSWENRLPAELEGQEISAAIAPNGFAPGSMILVGLVGAEIRAVAI